MEDEEEPDDVKVEVGEGGNVLVAEAGETVRSIGAVPSGDGTDEEGEEDSD